MLKPEINLKECPGQLCANSVDGNLVTAPAWPAHPEWIGKFLELLGSKIEP